MSIMHASCFRCKSGCNCIEIITAVELEQPSGYSTVHSPVPSPSMSVQHPCLSPPFATSYQFWNKSSPASPLQILPPSISGYQDLPPLRPPPPPPPTAARRHHKPAHFRSGTRSTSFPERRRQLQSSGHVPPALCLGGRGQRRGSAGRDLQVPGSARGQLASNCRRRAGRDAAGQVRARAQNIAGATRRRPTPVAYPTAASRCAAPGREGRGGDAGGPRRRYTWSAAADACRGACPKVKGPVKGRV